LKKVVYILLFLIIICLLIYSCFDNRKSATSTAELTPEQIDSIRIAKEFTKCDTFPIINYKNYIIKDIADLRRIISEFQLTKENRIKYRAFTTLNREELRFLRVGEKIIIPDSFVADLRHYSVFPYCYPGALNIRKIIIVSNQYQCYACYEYGKLVRFSAANTGKERTPTFPGRYALVWKERERRSSLDSNWVMPYTWNFHEYAGNAFHQFVMPGRAVSHSCIRQFMDDAKWLYSWGEGIKRDSNHKIIHNSGTTVIITGLFDFKRRHGGPWLELISNKDIQLDLPKKPMEVEEALIPWVQIPDASKSVIPNRKRYIYAEDTLRARGIIRPGVKLIPTVNFNKIRRERSLREAKEIKKKANAEKLLNSSTFTNGN
jgi:hypothetical protein